MKRVTRDFRGVKGVTGDDRGLQGVTEGRRKEVTERSRSPVTGGYKRLQGVTGLQGLQKVTSGYRGLQGVTGGYKG